MILLISLLWLLKLHRLIGKIADCQKKSFVVYSSASVQHMTLQHETAYPGHQNVICNFINEISDVVIYYELLLWHKGSLIAP